MPNNPYSLNFGAIPFSSAPGQMFAGLGGSPQQAMSALGPAYQTSYNAALNFNKALGQQVDTGYENTMDAQLAAQQGMLGDIEGYGRSSRNDISANNTRLQGDAMQSMIGRGLGNTTVLDAAKRGLDNDKQRQNIQLDDQLAAMRVNLKNQFNQQNTGLSQSRLAFLERMSGQYPSAALFGSLASQYGAANQGRANQGQVQDAMRRGQAAAGGGGAMGAIGGGGGGRQQSAFGPAFSGVNAPSYGPMPTGSGVGRGAYGYGGQYANYGLDPAGYYGQAADDAWQQEMYDASAQGGDFFSGAGNWANDIYGASSGWDANQAADDAWQQEMYDASGGGGGGDFWGGIGGWAGDIYGASSGWDAGAADEYTPFADEWYY